jgi:hypothetical protein
MSKLIKNVLYSGIITMMIVAPFYLTGFNEQTYTPTCDLCQSVQIIEPFYSDPGPKQPNIE